MDFTEEFLSSTGEGKWEINEQVRELFTLHNISKTWLQVILSQIFCMSDVCVRPP
jgi:hypothetical protein